LPEQTPQPLDEAPAAFDSSFGPGQIALRRAVRQHEPADRIGAVFGDDLVRVHDVLLGLRHFDNAADLDRCAICFERRALGSPLYFGRAEEHRLAVLGVLALVCLVRDHALREQAGEGLGHFDLTNAGQRAGPEAGVEQVQDRVLDPADILLNRQPTLNCLRIERPVIRLASEAQEVPRGIDESVERVGLAPRRVAALRAIDMLPGRVPVERVARHVEGHVFGQHDWQVLLGNRHHAADLAVDEWDRACPNSAGG